MTESSQRIGVSRDVLNLVGGLVEGVVDGTENVVSGGDEFRIDSDVSGILGGNDRSNWRVRTIGLGQL
ncbi:hypothetical protein CEXT_557151 [Caerostris extrusa]|uniref:Uncharacterized protein n=1 Tax=Caerostris extrusa TaxID=172846 RepID=A0AAV4NIG2_CAEEX|nr:hypothetical protein CEXT_557151 [Caerostris extrusa]